jgi:hypothetical protein
MSRAALLRRATSLSKDSEKTLTPTLLAVSETCIDSGRSLACIVRKLGAIDKFNSHTWWDIFYTVAASLILVLDIICQVKQGKHEFVQDSQKLLRDLAAIVSAQLQSSKVPGSMRAWGVIIIEVSVMADQYVLTSREQRKAGRPYLSPSGSPSLISPTALAHSGREEPPSSTSVLQTRENLTQLWAQLSYMDDTGDSLQDWSWDDIGEIVRGGTS